VRSDIEAIAHTHSPYATARSFDPAPLVFRTEERNYLGINEVPVAPVVDAGSLRLARLASNLMLRADACLLAHHGVVAAGRTPRDAVELCATIEHQAHVQHVLAGMRC
jgi:L-fuculose-phosphate aldolase